MPGMCTNIARGWLNERIEDALNDATKRADARKLLEDESLSLPDFCETLGVLDREVVEDRLMARHLRVDWFTDGVGFWPKLENKEEIVRQALIELIDTADKLDCPVGVRWVCMGSKDDELERRFDCAVTTFSEPKLALLVFLTPAIPYGEQQADGRAPTIAEPITVVCDTARKDRILEDTSTTGEGALPTEQECEQINDKIWKVPVFT